MDLVALYIDVPVATFRQSHSREYAKTYLYPPHSTIYGFLLSLVGEMNISRHCGVQLAIAMVSDPVKSKTLGIIHRFKFKDENHLGNKRPDFQEILTDIRFIVWMKKGFDSANPNLVKRLQKCLTNPSYMERWGCLYLGQSDNLIDIVKLITDDSTIHLKKWLVQDPEGSITLPCWVDHFGFEKTRWYRYSLKKKLYDFPPISAWTTIKP